MKFTRRHLIASTLALTVSTPAFAVEETDLNLSWTGLALRGVDPVSYFVNGGPKKGSRDFSVEYKGGTYRFLSAKNQKLFEKNPEAYLPAYGGFCAYGTAVNAKVDGDPYIWHIVDNQLYLNINRSIDKEWQTNVPGYIADANKNWKHLKIK
ncbi:MAG: YHS domain-containing (seleno)protein [Paracoccaceae bacterium]